jgi:ketosteroid isomerase-like protein
MNIFKTTALIIPLTLAACDQPGQTAATAEDLKALDQEFSDYSREHGYYEAFATYLADEAVALNAGRQPVIGLEAVLVTMEGGSGALLWTPVAGDISKSGDLGYTWGRYTFSDTDEAGEMQVSHGKYFTIWKLQDDGAWKVVLDGGNANPPPEQ